MLREPKICIVIPCYNNVGTIAEVALAVKQYLDDVVVVCDGCTDGSDAEVLKIQDKVTCISYTQNKGKGHAIKTGVLYAIQHNFDYMITIDADGQHFASDIPLFIKSIKNNNGAMIIGNRFLKQENMPEGNTFANKFSNFWFALQTGIYLPDTQSGFRAYPLNMIASMHLFTSRYEAELEYLVRLAWQNVKFVNIPIQVYYAPAGERVTHFRKGADFIRISMMNTVLCLLSIVYGYPSRLIRYIFNGGRHE